MDPSSIAPLYSISTTFRTRSDNGNWQPAYSNLMGNLIGASISNLYYPDGDRGLYPTLRRGLSITYQGTIGGLLQEFYPDIVQKYKNTSTAQSCRSQQPKQPPAPSATSSAVMPCILQLNSSRSRFVCDRLTGTSVCLRSSMRSW